MPPKQSQVKTDGRAPRGAGYGVGDRVGQLVDRQRTVEAQPVLRVDSGHRTESVCDPGVERITRGLEAIERTGLAAEPGVAGRGADVEQHDHLRLELGGRPRRDAQDLIGRKPAAIALVGDR